MATVVAPVLRPENGPRRRAQWLRRLPFLLALIVVLAALAAVDHLAGALDPQRIGAALAALPGWQIGAALGFTLASYLLLTGYDQAGVRQK